MAATIRDVAKRAGVSVSTASLALNGKPFVSPKTRRKVLQAAGELNYYPHATAKNLADGCTRTLSLLIPITLEHLFSSAGFFGRLLQGMHRAAVEQGYGLSLHVVESEGEAADRIHRIIRSRSADGLIITNPTVDPPYLALLESSQIPFIFLGRPLKALLPHVDNDNVEVGRMGTQHLLERGHKRIALLNGPDRFTFCLDREEGYRQALHEAGLPYDPSLVWTSALTEEDAHRVVQAVLNGNGKEKEFTALFAVSDIQAVGALRALRERGLRVPQDVALVCVNDTPLTRHFFPPLSAIHLHEDELGYWTVCLLIQQIRTGRGESRQVPSRLVVRESCGRGWDQSDPHPSPLISQSSPPVGKGQRDRRGGEVRT